MRTTTSTTTRATRYLLFWCLLSFTVLSFYTCTASETILTAEEVQAKKEEDKRLWGSAQQQQQQQQAENTPETSSANAESSSSSSSSSSNSSDNASTEDSSSSKPTTTTTLTHQQDDTSTTTTSTTDTPESNNTSNSSSNTIPFVSKSSSASSNNHNPNPNNVRTPQHHYAPPEGFQITARVYTNAKDKKSHFDFETSIKLPYWECGVSGSTTVPIPLQHGSIRHLLAGSKPTRFRGDEYGPHPQLVVALTPMEIILDSGATHTFAAGDVVLLEDVVRGGHKLQGHANQDMTVVILTLPQSYHHVGKDKLSLQKYMAELESPCVTDGDDPSQWGSTTRMGDALTKVKRPNRMAETMRSISPRSIRQYILGVVGVSASALLGDFMGKVAPLWVAVLFGGGCFVAGGTFAFVKVGDYLLEELQLAQERRRLRLKEDEVSEDGDDSRPIPPIDDSHHQRERFEGMNAKI